MFFCPQKLKKPPQKVAYLWQLGVCFLCSPDCPKQPRTSFQFYKFFYSIVSAKVSVSRELFQYKEKSQSLVSLMKNYIFLLIILMIRMKDKKE